MAVILLWVAAFGFGYVGLWRYSYTPGVAGNAPLKWPDASNITRISNHPTLVMVFHPHCPCSRASVGELALLMAHQSRELHAIVIFVDPPGMPDTWARTDLWASVGRIPGVERLLDSGREAQVFGAATSGQAMLYDEGGNLTFSGGITAARGHFGDNAGLNTIISMLDRQHLGNGAPSQSATFGCPLFDAHATRMGGERKCYR